MPHVNGMKRMCGSLPPLILGRLTQVINVLFQDGYIRMTISLITFIYDKITLGRYHGTNMCA
jgi:hypothetical protein